MRKQKKKIFIEEEQFIKRFKSIHIEEKLLELARKIYEEILTNKNIDNNKKIMNRKRAPVKCNTDWPICF